MTSRAPFPRQLPHSTSDVEAIARNDWDAFTEIDFLRNHWSVKQWPPGHSAYYWYLTFDDSALIELVDEYQSAFAQEALDPVPLDGLHLTLLGIGRTTTVTDDQIDSVISLARGLLCEVKPFDLAIGPLTGSFGAVRLSVSPWDPLFDLHEVLSAATAKSIPTFSATAGARAACFRPHLGIAYNNTDRPASDLIEVVAALRTTEPATVRVNRVELVALRREGQAYRWDTRATLPFAG